MFEAGTALGCRRNAYFLAIECESISDIAVLKAGHPGSCLSLFVCCVVYVCFV